jgi:hypothetical protein
MSRLQVSAEQSERLAAHKAAMGLDSAPSVIVTVIQ